MKLRLTSLIGLALAGSATVALAQGSWQQSGTSTLGDTIRVYQSESSGSAVYQLHPPKISNVSADAIPRATTAHQRAARFAAEERALQLASLSDVPFSSPPRQATIIRHSDHESNAQQARDFTRRFDEYQALSTS